MAVFPEEIQVIIQGQNERRFRPERDAHQIVLPRDIRRPHVERIGDQARHRRVRPGQIPHQLVDVRREHVDQPLHELVVVYRAVEAEGEAVGDGRVADVEAGAPRRREYVGGAVGAGLC